MIGEQSKDWMDWVLLLLRAVALMLAEEGISTWRDLGSSFRDSDDIADYVLQSGAAEDMKLAVQLYEKAADPPMSPESIPSTPEAPCVVVPASRQAVLVPVETRVVGPPGRRKHFHRRPPRYECESRTHSTSSQPQATKAGGGARRSGGPLV